MPFDFITNDVARKAFGRHSVSFCLDGRSVGRSLLNGKCLMDSKCHVNNVANQNLEGVYCGIYVEDTANNYISGRSIF